MTAFVVFAPSVLDRADFTGVDVGDKLPINITGMYPIYDGERLWIHEHTWTRSGSSSGIRTT